jgi:hypothetical protein
MNKQKTRGENKMTRTEFYAEKWDGVCQTCGDNYFECRGNCTCLSCNAQRQDEIKDGLWFAEDGEQNESNIEYADAASFGFFKQ